MSYFAAVSPYGGILRVTPRKAFLGIWLLLCVAALQILSRQDAQGWVSGASNQHTDPVPVQESSSLTPVLVANRSIKRGQKLTPDMFSSESRAVNGIEDRIAHTDVNLDRVYAAVDLRQGNVLLNENTTIEEPRNALAERIPNGFRAVAISVSPETAVEGWVQPGSRVDVVFTTTLRGERSITTLVDNVEVLSAERSLVPLTGKADTTTSPIPVPSLITLLVSADNAARIELAKHTGILSLILRGSDKSTGNSGDTITASQLLSVPNKAQTTGTVQVEGALFGITARGKMVRVDEERVNSNSQKQGGGNGEE